MTKSQPAVPRQHPSPNPIWCVVANIREPIPSGEDSRAIRHGTNKFHAGAKVYLIDAYWGMGGERVRVVGHYRGKRLIICSLSIRYLTNWRAQLIYNPGVLARLNKIRGGVGFQWDESAESKAKAQQQTEGFKRHADFMHQQRLTRRDSASNTSNPDQENG